MKRRQVVSLTMTVSKKRKIAEISLQKQWKWSKKDVTVLVRLVKQCQKLESAGNHGDWKTFLKVDLACSSRNAWKPVQADA